MKDELDKMYQEAIELHPELEGLPQPHVPNQKDDLVDQILDIINAQTWFLKWGEVMMQYTIEGEEKDNMRKRCECSQLWLDRARGLLKEVTSTEDRVRKKLAVLKEILWLTTCPDFNEFQRKQFAPIWNEQLILWAQKI